MEKVLYLNGVYDDTLYEILKSQEKNPGKVFYLQPYSRYPITQLKENPPTPDNPLSLCISTTTQLNQICYFADIVSWEDKGKISKEREKMLNEHMKEFQPKEGKIYFKVNGKECTNLLSIVNLKRMTNQLSTSNFIKESDGKPLGSRSQSGGWSYVLAEPSLLIEKAVTRSKLDEELENSVAASLKDNDKSRGKRLAVASKFPERVQVVSYGFRRNSDVIAAALKRADGRCELCGNAAPFCKKSDGSPYLEVHHWVTLSKGGEDTLENAGVLCPNCHKQAHFGQNKDFIKLNRQLKK